MSSVIVVCCIRSLTLTSPHAALLSNRYSDKEKENLVNIKYAVSGEAQGGGRRVACARGYRMAGLMPCVSLTFGLIGYMVCKADARLSGSLALVTVGEISTRSCKL